MVLYIWGYFSRHAGDVDSIHAVLPWENTGFLFVSGFDSQCHKPVVPQSTVSLKAKFPRNLDVTSRFTSISGEKVRLVKMQPTGHIGGHDDSHFKEFPPAARLIDWTISIKDVKRISIGTISIGNDVKAQVYLVFPTLTSTTPIMANTYTYIMDAFLQRAYGALEGLMGNRHNAASMPHMSDQHTGLYAYCVEWVRANKQQITPVITRMKRPKQTNLISLSWQAMHLVITHMRWFMLSDNNTCHPDDFKPSHHAHKVLVYIRYAF